MLVGLVGIIVPVIPGTLLIWVAALVFGLTTDFAAFGPWAFTAVTIVALITGTADFWLPMLGAKRTGAPKRALLLGFLGGILGTFITPIIGTIVGYAVGIILGSWHKLRDWDAALRTSIGGLAGWGLATLVQLIGAVLMIGIFINSILTN